MGEIVRGRSLMISGLAFCFRFALAFITFDGVEKPLDWWTNTVFSGVEWISTLMIIASLVVALIDDLSHNTYSHLLTLIVMNLVFNSIVVIMATISAGAFIGILIGVMLIMAAEMSLGAPVMTFIGILLSIAGILGPILVFLFSVTVILGINMVF